MMSKTDPHSFQDPQRDVGPYDDPSAHDDWHQLETFVDHLQELARSPIEVAQFYRELIDGLVTLLAAEAGAVWQASGPGAWQPIYQVNLDSNLLNSQSTEYAQHGRLLASVNAGREARIVSPQSGTNEQVQNPTAAVAVIAPVLPTDEGAPGAAADTLLELFHRPGTGPEVQQGWRELLETVALIAADFLMHQQLRVLQLERGRYDQSLALTRRFQQSTDLAQTASEIANEGRRFVGADRLSVVIKQRAAWRVLAASGVERIEPRADVTKRLQELAEATSDWGEPLHYADASATDSELPPKLESLVARHVDESQARKLVATPVQLHKQADDDSAPRTLHAVLVAEQFTSDEQQFSQQQLLELATLCEPALRQAIELDRFPMRSCLRWAEHWETICDRWGITKLTAACVAAALVVAALTFVRVDYEVAAPATLSPVVQRDVFATADGKVVDLRVAHGEQVQAGEVLATLNDPQLALDLQRVMGELATTRKRLEAIAVARTDRQVREEVTNEKLPLSAEAEQLEKRLASLQTQSEILTLRREALTLRSPIDGTVLTLDVQNMLQSRPVQRGQVLFTVADTAAGWRLTAEVPQDRIGQVVAARRQSEQALPVRFRLPGETDQTYDGYVASISTAAVVSTDDLDQPSPPFEVKVDIDQADQLSARPGMTAQAKIYCGRRSLGYIWLHDIWETVYGWVVF